VNQYTCNLRVMIKVQLSLCLTK